MDLLLKNATYIDWKTLEFSIKNMLVRENVSSIQFITDSDTGAVGPGTEIMDCTGRLVTKSFAVGNHHDY